MTVALALLQEDAWIKPGFGEAAFHNQTTLHPIGLAAVLVLGLATLVVSRRNAVIPMLVLVCFVSTAQRIVVASLDFNLVRVMVLAGCLRVVMRGEYRGLRASTVDRLILAWALVGTAAYSLLRGSMASFIFKAGMTYDVVGMYGLFRCWIRDPRDVERLAAALAWMAIPSALLFYQDHRTGRNPFAFFGGASPVTLVRDGLLRSQGPFVHPILAGCYWAALLPLIAARWWWKPRRGVGTLFSVTAVIAIVVYSASSTPLMVVMISLLGAFAWWARRYMRGIRRATLATLIVLHFVMAAPVWHLISRINAIGGSTGYHRFRLIDNAIRRFDDWALLGVKSTAYWGHFMFDVTNQYVKEGVRGGFLALVLFVLMIAYSFRSVGRLWRWSRRSRHATAMIWALGVSLFAQAGMFLSVSITHAQQNMLVFFLTLAAIASLDGLRMSTQARAARPVRRAAPQGPVRLRHAHGTS